MQNDTRAHWTFDMYIGMVQHMDMLACSDVVDAKKSRDALMRETAKKFPAEFLDFYSR